MVKRLYVDMDGTLARFYEQAFCIEKMHETGFFRELSPYSNAVGAIKQIITSHNEEVGVCILSAAGNEQIIQDKIDWLMKHFQILYRESRAKTYPNTISCWMITQPI